MTGTDHDRLQHVPDRRIRRHPLAMLASASLGIVGLLVFSGEWAGLRLNTTPSENLGLWRIESISRPLAIGDLVFICPPPTAEFLEGRRRGYLRVGLCPGGYGPLIKSVAALPRQNVSVSHDVTIDGVLIENSAPHHLDGHGRPLAAFRGGTVPAGSVFLLSAFPGSWDSRYFGPVPASGVLGLAHEVWTYAP